ncbi:MAG: hypothetical protein DI539_15770 [Flavobacterium psychrophilum]|nr:MAG: hypothetical protein DI539_15770 [Flavobacterium psychrophilum]
MLKKIWMPFMALSILGTVIGCSSQNDDVQYGSSNEIVLKSGVASIETERDFMIAHWRDINKMSEIIAYEIENGNLDFSTDMTSKIESIKNIDDLKSLFLSEGMTPSNADVLATVVIHDIENYNSLVSNNKNFRELSQSERNSSLQNTLENLHGENPDNLFPFPDMTEYTTPQQRCMRDKNNAYQDCIDDFGTTVYMSMGAGLFEGAAVMFVGIAWGGYEMVQCEKRVARNYKICMRDAAGS